MQVLIFGGAGQLGTELAAHLKAQGVSGRLLARADADISVAGQVRKALAATRPDVIVNVAAYTKVDLAEDESELAFRDNATGPAVLSVEAAKAGMPLVHVSTDYVFDGDETRPYTESDKVAPINVYGQSKLMGEVAIRERLESHVIVRTGWIYGRYGKNFLKTMASLAKTRDVLSVVADQYGTPTETGDLAAALVAVCRDLHRGQRSFGTYHFGGTGVTSWHDFAAEILATLAQNGLKVPVLNAITTEQYPTRALRPRYSALNSDRFFSTYGVRAAHWQQKAHQVVDALLAESV